VGGGGGGRQHGADGGDGGTAKEGSRKEKRERRRSPRNGWGVWGWIEVWMCGERVRGQPTGMVVGHVQHTEGTTIVVTARAAYVATTVDRTPQEGTAGGRLCSAAAALEPNARARGRCLLRAGVTTWRRLEQGGGIGGS